MTDVEIVPQTDTPREVSAAQALIPYRRDDARSKYLGYLACGFSDEEALFVLGLPYSWLEVQRRRDETFAELEGPRLPELRKELGHDYAEMDFLRNFRMVLEKDHRVLRKSLGMETDPETGEPAELSLLEHQYLLRLRSAYTPQQLQLLETVARGDEAGFNFAAWVSKNQDKIVSVSRTDTLTLQEANG